MEVNKNGSWVNPFSANFTPQKSENMNSQIMRNLKIKPIGFNPELARMANSATAGLFMSQLLYWWGKGKKKDCVYKSVKEFQNETGLTKSEQNTAIRIWKGFGVLEVKNKGVPCTRHFYLDTEKLFELLMEHLKRGGQMATRAAG